MKVLTIGRNNDCDVVINDSKVSRVHAQLVQDDNSNISIVDLGSANGTYVNGNKITSETRLKPGDEVRIGDTPLRWQGYFQEERKCNADKPPMPLLGDKKRMLYVACGVLVVLLLVGGYFILHGKQKTEEVLTELEDERDLREKEIEYNDAVKVYDSLRHEYKLAEERAHTAKTKQERDSLDKIVAEKAKQADVAKNNIENLKKEKEALGKELANANEQLQQKKTELDAAKAEKEKAVNEARTKIDSEKNKAEEARRQAELTNQFYEQLNKQKDSKKALRSVCKTLKIPTQGGNEELYNRLVSHFNEASNNEARKKIVDSLSANQTRQVKEEESEPANEKEVKQKQDSIQ